MDISHEMLTVGVTVILFIMGTLFSFLGIIGTAALGVIGFFMRKSYTNQEQLMTDSGKMKVNLEKIDLKLDFSDQKNKEQEKNIKENSKSIIKNTSEISANRHAIGNVQKIKEEFVKINQDQEQRINEKFEEQNANIENQLKSAG